MADTLEVTAMPRASLLEDGSIVEMSFEIKDRDRRDPLTLRFKRSWRGLR